MRNQLPAAAVALLCLLLGYRVWALDAEVEALEREVDRLESTGAPAPDEGPTGDGTETPTDLAAPAGDPALIAEVSRLREQLRALEAATAETATLEDIDTALADERILGVVQRRQDAVKAEQLSFARERWVGWRMQALELFTEQAGLEEEPRKRLKRLLEKEIDDIVELMKRPGADEDPWKVAEEWQALLDETDAEVEALLDDSQRPLWQHGRRTERRLLWPWLDAK